MVSFDIYDTLITRLVDKPTDIFYVMQDYLADKNILPETMRQSFAKRRIEAEKIARQFLTHEKEDVSLEDIYGVLCKLLCISNRYSRLLIKIEEKIEYDFSIGITNNISLLKEYKKTGEKIILISDMYLSTDFIRSILVKEDRIFNEIPIFVSSETGMTKSTGSIYTYIRDRYNVNTEHWIHYGDNEYSDKKIPELFGIKARYIQCVHALEVETRINNKISECNTLNRVFQGISNYIRNSKDLSDPYMVGACFGSRVLVPYVCWIISNAKEGGLSSLVFISRDGYVLKKIADELIDEKSDIKTVYVYGSRKAWRTDDNIQKKYLKEYIEENVLELDKTGFVDSNASGQSYMCMLKVLGRDSTNYSNYFFSYDLVSFEGTINELNQFTFCIFNMDGGNQIEKFCRAPYGEVKGYTEKDGNIVPIYNDFIGSEKYRNSIEIYSEGVRYASKVFSRVIRYYHYMREHGLEISQSYLDASKDSNSGIIYNFINKVINEDFASYPGTNDLYEQYAINIFKITGNKDGLLIIVYSAGKAGYSLYRHLCKLYNCAKIILTDINYNKFSANKNVIAPAEAFRTDYDYVVIPQIDGTVKKAFYRLILNLGVPENRIVYFEK